MLPAEELTMLDGQDASAKWADCSLVAVIEATDEDYTLMLPFGWIDTTLGPAMIDFGDGTSYTFDANWACVRDSTTHEVSNIFSHEYSPGTYLLKMKRGITRISAVKFDGALSWWSVSEGFGCMRNIVHCVIPLAEHQQYNSTWRLGDFTAVAPGGSVVSHHSSQTGVFIECDMLKLVHYGFYSMNGPWSQRDSFGFCGHVEELYLPNLVFDKNIVRSFCFCHCLKVLYIPKYTSIYGRLVSAVPERIDVYTGRLSGSASTTWLKGGGYRADGNNYFPDDSDTIPETGATVHLHVPMTSSEFRALQGWTHPTSGQETHPWGAKYLRVYATDLVFDSKGYFFDPETDHRCDENGVWLDDNGRWIDHDGNYVMPDGVTPAVWLNGEYYQADSQGRRVDDDGHYLDQYGNVVSDCGRPATSDGFFVTYTKDEYDVILPGNVVDFYGQTLYERYDLDYSWSDDHPEYSQYINDVDQRGGEGYWCYKIPEVLNGSTVEAWHFYDSSRHLVFKHYPAPPDGRLVSALINPEVLIPIGYSPSDGAGMQFRLVGRVSGDLSGSYTGQQASDLAELASNFADPLGSGLPANFGFIVSGVDDYPSDRVPVYGNAYESILEYPSLDDFPATGWGNAIFEAADTGIRYRWTGAQYEEAAEGDTEPRVIDTHAIVDYTTSPSVSKVYRLAHGWVHNPLTDYYEPYAVAQCSGSVVAIPCGFGVEDGEPTSDFDITFGNLFVTDNVAGETASGTEVEPPESEGTTAYWPQLRIGGNVSWPVSFWFKELEVSVAGSTPGSRVVLARFRPWMKNGVAMLKDDISGSFVSPTAGVMTPGEYYTT